MAHCFEFDSSNGIFRCRLEGDGIMDFSNVASFNVSSQTVRDLAHRTPGMPSSQNCLMAARSECVRDANSNP